MPVNYTEVQRQIREMGQSVPRVQQQLQERFERGFELLNQNAQELESLRMLVEQASTHNSHLRCAMPYQEPLDTVFGPPPPSDLCPVILAADGSQINPNRHERVEFGLINVGVFRITPGQSLVPQELVQSELLYPDGQDGQEPLTEELVALTRDLNERRTLLELAKREPQPVITLTDGPLELFREPKDDPRFEQKLDQYLDVLQALGSMNVATAGYVDKPRSDLVVRMLELILLRGRLDAAGKERPLRGLTDEALFRMQLQPGQRTAIFAIHSPTAQKFARKLGGRTGLFFFYLNVGQPQHPWLARVEIPAWVAAQLWLVNLLHASLIQQCRQMGLMSYPYALHRAHEIALVSYSEKQQLEEMIIAELHRQGIHIFDLSHKQFHKNLPRRARR